MSPLSDEQLILYYYGETPDVDAIARQLEESPEDRARFRALSRMLDSIPIPEAPERPEEYGAQVWSRVQERLAAPATVPARERRTAAGWRWLLAPQWGIAAAALALIAVSFLAGRYWPRENLEPERWVVTEETRDRILLEAVSGHLERAEMLLLELANSGSRETTDITVERSLADELSSEGRLYREAARAAGETDVVALLEELERLLIDLSHGPETLSAKALEQLQKRLEERDLLFRLRVVSARLHRASTSPFEEDTRPAGPTT